MKTGDEIARWLLEVIRHIYTRPEMYAATPSELEAVIWHHHFIWSWIVERGNDLIDARSEEMGLDLEYTRAMHSHEAIGQSPEQNRALFLPIVTYWQRVDRRIGILDPIATISD